MSRSRRAAPGDIGQRHTTSPPTRYSTLNPRTALAGTALIVDGLFLQRDEIADAWDLTVFLDVPVEVTARRMASRDGTSPDPEHPSMRRYVEAQRIYFNACSPHRHADILIDNRNLSAPRILSA